MTAVYSTWSGEAVGRLVAAEYAIEVAACWLYQRGFNDVYDLRAAAGARYIVRVDSRRARAAPNVAYELALLAHLNAEGVAVVEVIPTVRGTPSTKLVTPERARIVTVFRHLVGEIPDELADVALMGEGLARIHVAARSYRGPASVIELDLEYLVTRSLDRLSALPHLGRDAYDSFARLGAALEERISSFDGLTRVACHGDCHGANTLVRDGADGRRIAAFIDFDDGGPGWLAYDLAVYLWQQLGPSNQLGASELASLQAFLDGYRRIAPISEVDLAAVAAFVSARHFWFLGEYATRVDEWGASSLSELWLREQIAKLEAWRTLETPGDAR